MRRSGPGAGGRDWVYKGSTTRPTFDVHFGPDVLPGTQVWLVAASLSPRMQVGPTAYPVFAHVGYAALVSGEPSLTAR